jgi:AraC-like DNA-binding protein
MPADEFHSLHPTMPSLGCLPQALSAPPWSTPFRSDDLDEVRAFIGNRDGLNARIARRGQPLGYSLYVLKSLGANLGGSESAAAQKVRGHVRGEILQLAMPSGTVYQTGRRTSAPTGPGSVALIPAGWEFTRSSPAGGTFAIEVPSSTLSAELLALQPEGAARRMGRFELVDLRGAAAASVARAASDLIQATRPGTPRQQAAWAEGRVIELMAGLILRGSVDQSPVVLGQERAKYLEEWIEAHLEEPLTLGRLCQVAGVGARSLQKSFECRRGVSPMRWVTERRLVAAHHHLADVTRATTVTRTAFQLGFTHLGRFSVLYRQVLGETPSQTLAGRRSLALL